MKNLLLLFLCSLILSSCTEDVSRNINTDLTQEADQFFRFSSALGETGYLGNISYGDYFRISGDEIPGCPLITRNTATRTIILDYSNPQACEHLNSIPREGKIILDFGLSNTAEASWTMKYEDYSFGSIKIEGVRVFRNISFNENQESVENLKITLDPNLGFVVNGTLSYSVARLSARPFALSTRGRVEGTNPAGRNFFAAITGAKEQLFSCYRLGWELPQSGTESWIVSRGNSSSLEYMVKFETGDGCNPTVISTLPDGRTIQLNP
ncbi:hypothetical protein [Algoriphagus litoralis]|uniref:hypothetical protein n=1 Tax=Algoriphagus litoralis TaxID=2202829 RepID=UPI00130074A5|nr:hypothetical protein [Algoriphagus litoralis]